MSVFDPGKYAAGAGFFGFRQGGDGDGVGAYDTTTMRPLVKRYTGLAHLGYDLSDHVQGVPGRKSSPAARR